MGKETTEEIETIFFFLKKKQDIFKKNRMIWRKKLIENFLNDYQKNFLSQ